MKAQNEADFLVAIRHAVEHAITNVGQAITAAGQPQLSPEYLTKLLIICLRQAQAWLPHGTPDEVVREPELLPEALAGLDAANFRDQSAWFKLMCSCHHATAGQGFPEFLEWSHSDEGYTGDNSDIETRWNSLIVARQPPSALVVSYRLPSYPRSSRCRQDLSG